MTVTFNRDDVVGVTRIFAWEDYKRAFSEVFDGKKWHVIYKHAAVTQEDFDWAHECAARLRCPAA